MNDDTRELTTAHGSPVAVTVGKDVAEISTLIELVELAVAVPVSWALQVPVKMAVAATKAAVARMMK
jgi:hypothetical protein